MRHVKMLGLCLVAVLALGAYAVSSASALPEWGKCVAKTGGKYLDSNCTQKGTLKNPGSFEFEKGRTLPNVPFTSHNVGGGGVLQTQLHWCGEKEEPNVSILEKGRLNRHACAEKGDHPEVTNGTARQSIECESNSATGEQHSTKQVINVKVIFTGCKIFGSSPCKSAGAAEGEIATSTLKGELGYIKKSEKRVGILLTPAKAKASFASFTCDGGVIRIGVGAGNEKEGSFYTTSGCIGECPNTTPAEEKFGGFNGIIAPITPVDTMSSAFTLVYSINSETVENIPSKFEGKHLDLLEDFAALEAEETALTYAASPAGEEVTDENIPSEAGEIKA